MTITITINGLTLVHRSSGGVSRNTLPDVCKTPPYAIPRAFSNTAYSKDLANGTTTVFADGGNMIANYGSIFAKSTGDEGGSMGGVKSGTFIAEADWITHSPDVYFEGKGACRLTDKMYMNHRNTVNMAGCHNPSLTPEEFEKWLCKLACECFNLHQKGGAQPLGKGQTFQGCVAKKIADECYDGRYPKPDSDVWKEVPYDRKSDWDMIGSKSDPNVPTSNYIRPDSRRPDVVWRDAATGVIKKLFDMKFPGDPSGSGQMDPTRRREYEEIADKHTGDSDNYEEFDVEERCKGCMKPAPAPEPAKAPAPGAAPASAPEQTLEQVVVTGNRGLTPGEIVTGVVIVAAVVAVAVFAGPIVAAIGGLFGLAAAI